MRKTILVGLVAIAAGVFLAPLLILIAAYAAPAVHADSPPVRPRVRALESPLIWVSTINHESVKLQDADTALLGGESFLTGKPLSEAKARVSIPADRVRALAEFTSRDELEEFDDDDVLVKDDSQKLEVDTIEMNVNPNVELAEPPVDDD